MINVNGVGLICPLPVIMTKKALNSIESGEVEVIVDNLTAKENIEKLALELKFKSSSTLDGENYKIIIEKTIAEDNSPSQENNLVIVIDSDEMGSGDRELGTILIQGFIYSLTEIDTLPKTILLYNKGVFLASKNQNTIEDLKKLESLGVEVLSCGACVNYYKVQEELQVGKVTNMYEIINKQVKASKVIKV